MSADDVARHLRSGDPCRVGLEAARRSGPEAMAAWRREFAQCLSRRPT